MAAIRARFVDVAVGLGLALGICLPSGAAPSGEAAHVVHVYRDRYGMAHLHAAREEDGFYGLGYATAQDRLIEVLTWYLAVRGELAATFGNVTPPLPGNSSRSGKEPARYRLYDARANDLRARKYQLLDVARRNLGKLPAQFQKDLEAYVRGIEAFMHDHPASKPAWAPELEAALPLALLHLWVLEQEGVCAARRSADRAATSPAKAAASAQRSSGTSRLGASNAWAVSGSRTADGRVIMASDSHGPLDQYGTTFYPYRIRAGKLDIVGFDRPGSVNFLFGHSPFYAWALTEGPRFVADCYRVKVDPESPRTYLFDGQPEQMVTLPYRVRVKGGADLSGTFEYTQHNGVLSPVEERDGDTAYVVSYASGDRIGLYAGEGYRIATAATRRELEAALAERDMYPANLIIGGADGTIMYIRPGRIPVRPPGVDARRTLDGNTSATTWRGIHSYADTLKLINPPQGYISNSNVSPDMMYPDPVLQPGDYPSYFGFEPGYTQPRQLRQIELLATAKALTVADAKAIVMDETIIAARPWGPALARILADRGNLLAGFSPDLLRFMEELAAFDGAFSKESRAALYHAALRKSLHDRHPGEMDRMQEAIEAEARLSSTQEELLIDAAAEAYEDIRRAHGRTDLTWGDVHRVGRGSADYPIGGGVIVLGVARGDEERGSYLGIEPPWTSAATLRALAFEPDSSSNRVRVTYGQRIPFLVHFGAEGVESFAQALPGVSDDPASPHYSDQARLASEKELRRIPLSLTALKSERATESVLRVPKRRAAR